MWVLVRVAAQDVTVRAAGSSTIITDVRERARCIRWVSSGASWPSVEGGGSTVVRRVEEERTGGGGLTRLRGGSESVLLRGEWVPFPGGDSWGLRDSVAGRDREGEGSLGALTRGAWRGASCKALGSTPASASTRRPCLARCSSRMGCMASVSAGVRARVNGWCGLGLSPLWLRRGSLWLRLRELWGEPSTGWL